MKDILLSILANQETPALLQQAGIAVLTLLLPMAILVLEREKEDRNSWRSRFILEGLFNIRSLFLWILLMFFPCLFWGSGVRQDSLFCNDITPFWRLGVISIFLVGFINLWVTINRFRQWIGDFSNNVNEGFRWYFLANWLKDKRDYTIKSKVFNDIWKDLHNFTSYQTDILCEIFCGVLRYAAKKGYYKYLLELSNGFQAALILPERLSLASKLQVLKQYIWILKYLEKQHVFESLRSVYIEILTAFFNIPDPRDFEDLLKGLDEILLDYNFLDYPIVFNDRDRSDILQYLFLKISHRGAIKIPERWRLYKKDINAEKSFSNLILFSFIDYFLIDRTPEAIGSLPRLFVEALFPEHNSKLLCNDLLRWRQGAASYEKKEDKRNFIVDTYFKSETYWKKQ